MMTTCSLSMTNLVFFFFFSPCSLPLLGLRLMASPFSALLCAAINLTMGGMRRFGAVRLRCKLYWCDTPRLLLRDKNQHGVTR